MQRPNKTEFKVSIIGCGNVGATAGYAMLLDGTPSELVMIDVSKEKAKGLVLDFEHSLPFLPYTKISGGSDFAMCADSNFIVMTAGARQVEGETRLDLIKKNRAIFQSIIPKIAKIAPNSILLIVTNPVDVLTYEAIKLAKFPAGRVFGSGTMLDSARLRFHISKKLNLSPHSVNAFILGEHGDSSFPVWSSANIGGKPILEFEKFTKKVAERCYSDTKSAAYRIIHDMGFTCYSIGTVIREIMHHIFQNSREVLPLSILIKDYYGQSDVALSVPCVLDSTGISEIIKIPLNKTERKQLADCAKILCDYNKK